jgi:hypothetical protein
MCAGTAGSKSGMFVSLSAVIGIVIVLIVLGLWGASVIKNNIKQEKLASFGYPLGVIIECILIKDDLQRVSEVARRLGSLRVNISDRIFEHLFRAGICIYVVKNAVEHAEEKTSTALIDVAGEYVRQLGVSVAGAGQPKAQALAALAISICQQNPSNILPADKFAEAVLADRELTTDGQSAYALQDIVAAQLIIERQLLKVYGDGISTKLLFKAAKG